MNDYYVIAPCTTANGVEIKLNGRRIDMAKAEAAFSGIGEVVGSSAVVLLARVGGYTVSVYGSGRMMVKGKKLSGKKAEALASRIVGALEAAGAVV